MEMKTIRYMMAMLLGILMLAACSGDDELLEPRVSMPIRISIPAADIGSYTRAPGDPGTYEKFELPRYLWVYMVQDDGSSTEVVEMKEALVLNGSWTEEMLNNNDVYTYAAEVSLELPQERTGATARIYAILSAYNLSTVPTITKNTSTESDVLGLTFDLPVEEGKTYGDVARNIYSTPYNLNRSDSKYYGTVNNYAGESPYVENFMLYHVAAKLDVMWNVNADQQTNVKLNKLDLNTLKKKGCKAFKPLENAAVGADSYNESITLDAGQQWYGRHSFYVIPYGDTYPVNMTLYKVGNETGKVVPTIDVSYKSATSIFTPWIVAPLEITNNIP